MKQDKLAKRYELAYKKLYAEVIRYAEKNKENED